MRSGLGIQLGEQKFVGQNLFKKFQALECLGSIRIGLPHFIRDKNVLNVRMEQRQQVIEHHITGQIPIGKVE
jgi:hypothetical protein